MSEFSVSGQVSGAELMAELKSVFMNGNAALYVGMSAKQEDIDALASFPWMWLITRREEPDLFVAYPKKAGRQNLIDDDSDMTGQSNRQTLHVVRLKEDDPYEQTMALSPLKRFLNRNNLLVLLGCDETKDREIDPKFWKTILKGASPKCCQLWGCSDELNETLASYGFHTTSESPADALSAYEDRETEYKDEAEDAPSRRDFFYCAGKSYAFDPIDYDERFRGAGSLLSRDWVFGVNPETDTQGYFKRFLEESAVSGPQWYGYYRYQAGKKAFYINRSFEKELYDKALEKLKKKALRSPLVLCGEPGSGKTVTMGFTAFRLFYEKRLPVIWLNTGDRSGRHTFRWDSDELSQLEKMLETLSDLVGTNPTFLLVWDSSHYKTDSAVYQSVRDNATDLIRLLNNRGRNVLLLCSAYLDNTKVEDEKNTVRSTRQLTESEENSLQGRFSEFLNSSEDSFSMVQQSAQKDFKRNADLFDYIFHLVTELRVPINSSLRDEQDIGGDYVRYKLKDVIGEDAVRKASYNPFLELFRQEGLLTEKADPEKTGNSEIRKNLDRMNLLCALFCAFGLEVPVEVAMDMLDLSLDMEMRAKVHAILTREIPWLIYRVSDEGIFYLRFRNVIEAQQYLEREDPDAAGRKALIGELVQSFLVQDGYDERFAQMLQNLFRLIGPNSKYYRTMQGNPYRDMWEQIREWCLSCDEAVDKWNCADVDFGILYVTYTREQAGRADGEYGFYVEETREKLQSMRTEGLRRLLELQDRIKQAKALRGDKKLEQSSDNLAVEKGNYYSAIIKLEDQLRDEGEQIEDEIRNALRYKDVKNDILDALGRNPTNIYIYNALFKVFFSEYEHLNGAEKETMQIRRVVELQPVHAECLEIQSGNYTMSSNQELCENLSRFSECSDSLLQEVTVDTLLKRADPAVRAEHASFFATFDKMLDSNNPACVVFICNRALKPLWAKTELDENDLKLCRTVRALLTASDGLEKEPDAKKIKNAVRSNDYALYLLLQTVWAISNHRPLKPWEELQRTFIKKEGWIKIWEICDQFLQIKEVNNDRNGNQFVVLLQKVATYNKDSKGISWLNSELSKKPTDSFMQKRMFYPLLLCDENGNILNHFSGKVTRLENKKGFIEIDKTNIYFYRDNMKGWKPDPGALLTGLSLAVGYPGLSAYSEESIQMKTSDKRSDEK